MGWILYLIIGCLWEASILKTQEPAQRWRNHGWEIAIEALLWPLPVGTILIYMLIGGKEY